jgi:hypothetical protein
LGGYDQRRNEVKQKTAFGLKLIGFKKKNEEESQAANLLQGGHLTAIGHWGAAGETHLGQTLR